MSTLIVSLTSTQLDELRAIILDPELGLRTSRKLQDEFFVRTFNITQTIRDIVYIGNGCFTIEVN